MNTRTRWNSLRSQEARLGWLLVAPTAIIVFGLILFPALFSVWISVHQVGLNNLNDVFHAPYVGLRNFTLVFNDFAFKYHNLANMGALVTTIVYSFAATALAVLLGLTAALLLNRPFYARGVARSLLLFPYVAPIVSVAYVWRWMLDPRPSGVINDLLIRMGVLQRPVAFLAQRGIALLLVIIFDGWRYFPFAMLMLLARLQAVDRTLYEAAEVDGANNWQKFRHITLPELRYVLGAVFLLRLIWTFNKFDDIFLLTGGGFGTRVLPVLVYQFSFRTYNFGKGAAAAMILVVSLVVFIAFYVQFVMRQTEEE